MIFSLECDRWLYRRLYILWQHNIIDLRHYPILFCKITVPLTQKSILCCTRGDLRCSFQLLFPYCACVVKISGQKLCVTIKRWLPGSNKCFLVNRLFMRNSWMFSVTPISHYTVTHDGGCNTVQFRWQDMWHDRLWYIIYNIMQHSYYWMLQLSADYQAVANVFSRIDFLWEIRKCFLSCQFLIIR